MTRTERTPSLLAARAKELGISAYLTAFLASDKAWAVTGELVVATGGAGRSVYY